MAARRKRKAGISLPCHGSKSTGKGEGNRKRMLQVRQNRQQGEEVGAPGERPRHSAAEEVGRQA